MYRSISKRSRAAFQLRRLFRFVIGVVQEVVGVMQLINKEVGAFDEIDEETLGNLKLAAFLCCSRE